VKSDLSHETVIKRMQRFFARRHEGIVCVYLYGSMARGEAHQSSDIDIAVLYAESPPLTLDGLGLDLGSALEQELGRSVDVVVLNRAPVDLVHRVLRDGELLCDHSPSARIRFEVQARNAYFDLLPYLRQYRRVARSPKS
jgi:predicted nucleotidyltransferase